MVFFFCYIKKIYEKNGFWYNKEQDEKIRCNKEQNDKHCDIKKKI